MKVFFKAAQRLGNRAYAAGEQEIPDHLAYNLGFKKLVVSGQARILPRDAAAQKILAGLNARAVSRAKERHERVKAAKAAMGPKLKVTVQQPQSKPVAAAQAQPQGKKG